MIVCNLGYFSWKLINYASILDLLDCIYLDTVEVTYKLATDKSDFTAVVDLIKIVDFRETWLAININVIII